MKTVKKPICFIGMTLLILLCIVGCVETQTPPVNDDPPSALVSVGQAKEMFDSYSRRRVNLISEFEQGVDTTKAFHPTRYGEYNYETVKQYMAFIESEAKLANVEIGGLRFYLTNYPNATQFEDGTTVKYPRQNSFVLVPTTAIEGEQRGFITRVTSNNRREVVLVSDWLQEQRGERQQKQQSELKKTTGMNMKNAGYGVGKPKFLFINAMMGANMSVDPGDDVSLLLNESNLVPPPPQQETDFDD